MLNLIVVNTLSVGIVHTEHALDCVKEGDFFITSNKASIPEMHVNKWIKEGSLRVFYAHNISTEDALALLEE